jgi:hypothetical protein
VLRRATTRPALCADANGDVFVTAYTGDSRGYFSGYVFEYEHGGFDAECEFKRRRLRASACAVDPTSGSLAVANLYYNGGEETAMPQMI